MKLPQRLLLILAALLLAAVAGVEGYVRSHGMADFPLYLADPQIGYIIAPNQHGAFLNRNHWEFNEYSMGSGPFRPEGKRNVLLLGDSIVLGGNPLDQSVRLGPTLGRELGAGANSSDEPWSVWSSAAQSWSSVNEAVYLKRYPQVVDRMEWLVWVMNNGDYQGLSVWRSNRFNPRHHPLWQTLYVFDKQVWSVRVEPGLPPALRFAPADPLADVPRDARMPEFQAFVQHLKQIDPRLHILLVWYPESAELHPPPGDFYLRISAILKTFSQQEGLSFIDLAREPEWSAADYRDQIHPSGDGNRAFARIVKRAMDASLNGAPYLSPDP